MNLQLIKEQTWSTQNESFQPEYLVRLNGSYVYVGADLDKAKTLYHKIEETYQKPTKEILLQTEI